MKDRAYKAKVSNYQASNYRLNVPQGQWKGRGSQCRSKDFSRGGALTILAIFAEKNYSVITKSQTSNNCPTAIIQRMN